jgi:hypothetical protein
MQRMTLACYAYVWRLTGGCGVVYRVCLLQERMGVPVQVMAK